MDFSNIHIKYKFTKDGWFDSSKPLGHIVSFQALIWLKIHHSQNQSQNSLAIFRRLSIGIVRDLSS